MKAGDNLDEFYRKKRTKRNLERKKRRESAGTVQVAPTARYQKVGVLVRRLSRYLYELAQFGKPRIIDYQRKTEAVQLPKVFDLTKNPVASIRAICVVCHYLLNPKVKFLSINHDGVDEIGYSAEALLSVVTSECRNQIRKSKRKPPELRGSYAASARVQKMMNKAGIVVAAGANDEEDHDHSEAEYFVRRSYFERISQDDDDQADRKTLACRDMQKHINNCLEKIDLELTAEAEDQLGVYVGEIIGNAEDHSEELLWFISGYFDPESHVCEVVILNFGLSIFDTFKALPKDHFSRERGIQPYIDRHLSSGFSEAQLTTVAALQGSISSKNEGPDDTRGSGSIDIIEFFQDISNEINDVEGDEASMSMLSGNVQLVFDDETKLSVDEKGRQIMAFNTHDSLQYPPESGNVRSLSGISFPGTLISIQFSIPISSSLVSATTEQK